MWETFPWLPRGVKVSHSFLSGGKGGGTHTVIFGVSTNVINKNIPSKPTEEKQWNNKMDFRRRQEKGTGTNKIRQMEWVETIK